MGLTRQLILLEGELPRPDKNLLFVIQYRLVILETIYRTPTKTDSETYMCSHTHMCNLYIGYV